MNEKELKLLDQLIVEYELRAKYNLSQEDYLMLSMLLKARAHLSPEYEERIRADERKKINFAEQYYNHPWLDNHEEEIRADERRKFAEEIKQEFEYAYHANVSKKRLRGILLDMLKKEQKGEIEIMMRVSKNE